MAWRGGKTRWNVERRLEFIDFRLQWEGHINRADLVNFFGISVPQASADLGLYQKAAKKNISYDATVKAYVASPQFRPAFTKPSPDAYLAQLRLVAAGILAEGEFWGTRPPPFAVVPTLRRHLDTGTLRRILEAIHCRASLEVCYQSFSHRNPSWRWVAPHALGFDGSRWHARAWCETHADFRDFVMARIIEMRGVRPSDPHPENDAEWHRQVALRIGPHPGLTDGRRRVVELDYGMVDGVIEVKTRVCLSYYLERHLGLDFAPSQVPAERQQIVMLNRDEVEAARREAKAASNAT